MMRLLILLLASCTLRAFQTTTITCQRLHYHAPKIDYWRLKDVQSSSTDTTTIILSTDKTIHSNDLMVMDVVLFQRRPTLTNTPSSSIELGAVQENGNIAPLSTWTLESAYTSAINDMMEFVVDEEDLFPGLQFDDDIQVLSVLTGDVVGYGSRQVGGGKGPGNPHGEESEIIYYVDRSVVEGRYAIMGEEDGEEVLKIDVVVNPGLEHLW